MPIYDLICENGHKQYDLYLKLSERPPCPECGEKTDTLWERSSGVIPDDIPGGFVVAHGICWPDGTPRKYYSKSDMKREAERLGLTNHVEHIGEQGSDKSKHTSKWV